MHSFTEFSLEIVLINRKACTAWEEPEDDHDDEHHFHIAASTAGCSVRWLLWAAVKACSIVAVDGNEHQQRCREECRDEDCSDHTTDLKPDASFEEPEDDEAAAESIEEEDNATEHEQHHEVLRHFSPWTVRSRVILVIALSCRLKQIRRIVGCGMRSIVFVFQWILRVKEALVHVSICLWICLMEKGEEERRERDEEDHEEDLDEH